MFQRAHIKTKNYNEVVKVLNTTKSHFKYIIVDLNDEVANT